MSTAGDVLSWPGILPEGQDLVKRRLPWRAALNATFDPLLCAILLRARGRWLVISPLHCSGRWLHGCQQPAHSRNEAACRLCVQFHRMSRPTIGCAHIALAKHCFLGKCTHLFGQPRGSGHLKKGCRRLVQQVAQHIQAPPVGHAHFDALDAMLSAALHHLLQPWQQGL